METEFLSALDSDAANTLALLEAGHPPSSLSNDQRRYWSRFLFAQLLRSPEDIAQLRQSVGEEWAKVLAKTAERLGSTVDAVAAHTVAIDPASTEKLVFKIGRTLMEHTAVCQLIDNMVWIVLDAPSGIHSMTSDRPVWMTPTFSEENAFVSIPIGPRKIFFAARDHETASQLRVRDPSTLIKERNKLSIQHAVRFVYAQNDGPLRFVQRHFAAKRHSSLLERLAAFHGHAQVNRDAAVGNSDIP